jgi:hypothetical protein
MDKDQYFGAVLKHGKSDLCNYFYHHSQLFCARKHCLSHALTWRQSSFYEEETKAYLVKEALKTIMINCDPLRNGQSEIFNALPAVLHPLIRSYVANNTESFLLWAGLLWVHAGPNWIALYRHEIPAEIYPIVSSKLAKSRDHEKERKTISSALLPISRALIPAASVHF